VSKPQKDEGKRIIKNNIITRKYEKSTFIRKKDFKECLTNSWHSTMKMTKTILFKALFIGWIQITP